jgi:ankyrin repeat protein
MHIEANFLTAVQKGDLDQATRLLAQQPSLASAHAENGLSAVLLAAYNGHPELARLLAGHRHDLDIFEASATGDLERVKTLLSDHPELANAVALDGFQPLGLASFFGHYEVARFLVERRAEINSPSRNPQKVMPLHSAAASRSLEIARLLLEHGADPDARQNDDFTPLHEAAANGQLEMVSLLLAHGADVNLSQKSGRTALSFAQNAGHQEVVEFLLRHGASDEQVFPKK